MPLIINGQRIDDAIVDNEFSQIKAYYENLGNVSCCERDPEFRATARDNITSRVLMAQEAARGMPASSETEIDAAFDKLAEQYGGRDYFFMRTGATPDQLPLVRRDIDIDLRVKRMVEQFAEVGPNPTNADLLAHYQANLQDFMTDEQVRVSHILKGARGGENQKAAYETLRALRKVLQAGGDFEAAAKAHSERAEDNIDLGFFKQGEVAPEFESVAFSLDVGEISPIFITSYGMHLIAVTERKPSTPKVFEEIKDEVLQHLKRQRQEAETRKLVDRLKQAATVEQLDPELEAAEAMS